MQPGAELDRALNLPLLTLFGLGTMIGAGIYVLVGKIIGTAGANAPWSFLLAAVVAGFTARSYGELAARYPLSGGEVVYVHEAFGKPLVTTLTGWAVVLTGLVSAATLANGFAAYLLVFAPQANGLAVAGFVIALGALAAWGIRQTAWVAGAITVASIAGLIAVLIISREHFARRPEVWTDLLPSGMPSGVPILLGAFIAFYAFVGFEDMVNVAEETREPEKTLPPAIMWALVLATVLYLLVAVAAVLASYEIDLANHPAPLAAMVEHAGPGWTGLIAALSMLAVTNSALAQIVMASRVLYGMAKQGRAPVILARVHASRQTPLTGTVVVTAAILLLALLFPLLTLAKATSFIILCIFVIINVSLIYLKLAGEVARRGLWIPVLGALLSAALLGSSVF